MTKKTSSDSELDRLWGARHPVLRAFISHTSKHRTTAIQIKSSLDYFRISCFVSDEDIESLSKWRAELVKALTSMDVLIALLTPDFHESEWTDQEVGAAVGRKVKIVPVKIGKTPYGFMATTQAIQAKGQDIKSVSDNIFAGLMKHCRASIKTKLQDCYIESLRDRESFDDCARWMRMFTHITALSEGQVDHLVEVYNANCQANGARALYGLDSEINKLSKRKFRRKANGWYGRLKKVQDSGKCQH